MSQLALIVGNFIVSFSLLVLIDHLIFGIPWSAAVLEALIATILGHWLGLLWLHHLRKD